MSKNTSFNDYVVYDLLGDFPNVSSRAMFGGHGIYKDSTIFAIIAEGELYFKGQKETEDFFRSRNSRRFTYRKRGGKTYTMNYWLVPEEVCENRDAFTEWVERALVGA